MDERRLSIQKAIDQGAERYAAEPAVQRELESKTAHEAEILGVDLQELRRIRLAELLNAEARRRGMDVQDLAMQLSGISPEELAELQAERRKSVAAAIGVDHLL